MPREPIVVERQLTAAERRFQVLAQPPPRFWRAVAAQHFGGCAWLLYQRAVCVQDLKEAIVRIEQHFEDGACAGLESRLRVSAAHAARARVCGQRAARVVRSLGWDACPRVRLCASMTSGPIVHRTARAHPALFSSGPPFLPGDASGLREQAAAQPRARPALHEAVPRAARRAAAQDVEKQAARVAGTPCQCCWGRVGTVGSCAVRFLGVGTVQ